MDDSEDDKEAPLPSFSLDAATSSKSSSSSSSSSLDVGHMGKMKVGGDSKSGTAKQGDALTWFDKFLQTSAEASGSNILFKSYTVLNEADICQLDVFNAFCEYMKRRPISDTTGQPLAVNTCRDYFCAVVLYFMHEKYPSNEIWNGCGGNRQATPFWYSILRQRMVFLATVQAQKKGEVIVNKSEEMSRETLNDVIANLMKKCCLSAANGGGQASCVQAILIAFLLVLTFAAVGRGSEAAVSSWDTARWSDVLGCLVFTWPDLKTGTPEELSFFNDYMLKNLDVYFMMALYLISGAPFVGINAAGVGFEANFIFPNAALQSSPLAATLTKAIKVNISEIPAHSERAPNLDATSLR